MLSLAKKLGMLGAGVDAKIRATEAANAARIEKQNTSAASTVVQRNDDLALQDQELRSLFAKFDVPWEGETARKVFDLTVTRLEAREHRARRVA